MLYRLPVDVYMYIYINIYEETNESEFGLHKKRGI